MPFKMETPGREDPPTDAEIDVVNRIMRSWKWVEPHQRAQLRATVAGLPLIESPRPEPPATTDRGLPTKEVAQLLRVHPATVLRMIREGRLAGYTLSGRKGSEYRVPESEVRRFLGGAA